MERDGIIAPHVHLNGTAKNDLVEQLSDAYSAINEAISAVARSAPNGRDYYPIPGLMDRATAQHLRRLEVLSDMLGEIEAQVAMIDEQ